MYHLHTMFVNTIWLPKCLPKTCNITIIISNEKYLLHPLSALYTRDITHSKHFIHYPGRGHQPSTTLVSSDGMVRDDCSTCSFHFILYFDFVILMFPLSLNINVGTGPRQLMRKYIFEINVHHSQVDEVSTRAICGS